MSLELSSSVQTVLVFVIVIITFLALLWRWKKRRSKNSGACGQDCGCEVKKAFPKIDKRK